jgi:hypothetical protein
MNNENCTHSHTHYSTVQYVHTLRTSTECAVPAVLDCIVCPALQPGRDLRPLVPEFRVGLDDCGIFLGGPGVPVCVCVCVCVCLCVRDCMICA